VSYGPIPTLEVRDLPDPVPDELHILDVREELEWRHGHIDGAVHVPLGQLPARMGEVPEGPVVVVCKVGGRSAQAVAYLGASGYDVVNLHGGMLDWVEAGRPMVSETGQPPHVV
jgi:rhodanese-related sulfurtransferase